MKLKKLQVIGFVFTVVIGTALHFTYEWSGNNAFIGAFSAVNESVWEHLKLLSVPMLLFGTVEYFIYGKNKDNFIPVRFRSILLGMTIIVTVFYTYTGIIGEHYAIVDILLFIFAAYLSYRYSYKMLKTDKYSSKYSRVISVLGLIVLVACIVVFTFSPPHIDLFRDPNTGSFGAAWLIKE